MLGTNVLCLPMASNAYEDLHLMTAKEVSAAIQEDIQIILDIMNSRILGAVGDKFIPDDLPKVRQILTNIRKCK